MVRRLGVLGGWYHPTQSCRANFLTPVSTILTDILQEVRVHLYLVPPLPPPSQDDTNNNDRVMTTSNGVTNELKNNNPPGIPSRSARFAINFHFMQVL